MTTTVVSRLRRFELLDRPSFRLSGSIAFGSLFSLTSDKILATESCTRNKGQYILRIYVWLRSLGVAIYIFSAAYIAFHLHLITIWNKAAVARKLKQFYELICWSLALVLLPVPSFMDISLPLAIQLRVSYTT